PPYVPFFAVGIESHRRSVVPAPSSPNFGGLGPRATRAVYRAARLTGGFESAMKKRALARSCALSTVIAIAALGAAIAFPQTNILGLFTNEGSVGETPPGCRALYDPSKAEYRITGGGANMWAASDAFYFVWKKVSGDFTLTADIQWVGTSAAEHRKAVLIARQGLDPGSPYADAVSHGNGLTSLQFRGAPNEQTYQIVAAEDGASRLRI